MASVQKKSRKCIQISCRRKKKSNKPLLQERPQSNEKSLVYFHTYLPVRRLHASYLFSFEDKAEQGEEEAEEDYRYRILHGPYGLGRSVLPPIFGPLPLPSDSDAEYLGSLVALGSKIYYLNRTNFTIKVHCLDTCNPGGVWTEVAPLIMGKCYFAVAVDNKIYAVTTFKAKAAAEAEAEPWGQVFDPVLNKWSPMPEPPSPNANYFAHVDDVDEKTILVNTDEGLCGYNVRTHSWFVSDEKFNERKTDFSRGPPVVVNRWVYWFADNELMGYDLEEKEVYIGKFGYLDLLLRGISRHPGDSSEYATEFGIEDNCQLLALGGGKLCLVWQHDKPVGPYTDPLIVPNLMDSTFDCVYCIKFEASKVIKQSKEGNVERILNISIESSKSFMLRDRGMELIFAGAV